MFDISFGELIIVLLVGLLVLGPREMLRCLKTLKSIWADIKGYYNEFTQYLSRELDNDDFVKIVYDPEGNPQKVYDIDKLKPYLHTKKPKTKKGRKKK